MGSKAPEADGYKLWYSGRVRDKNGVDILVDMDLRELVVEVKRVNDRLMAITLVVGRSTLNVISAYEEISMVTVGRPLGVMTMCMGFGFGVRNGGGTSLLDCAKAFDLVIVKSCFPKREEHLVIFKNSLAKT
ncbi:uncharacterized protein LOC107827537 [Nicotiana tabacum]|uniref:Uncharacterized protein LOC107827537 n=1 Tax=Nicotiana tabacum TaxID=4097 RepID=A0AC58RP52_TOBAC